ncbi:MAG: ABC transporter permease subunit [Eubacterium sp.]
MLFRLVRSLTLVEKNKTYVEAATSIGYSDVRIMFRHILPNCVSTITVQVTLDLAYAILDLAALSFLGLGVQPPTQLVQCWMRDEISGSRIHFLPWLLVLS